MSLTNKTNKNTRVGVGDHSRIRAVLCWERNKLWTRFAVFRSFRKGRTFQAADEPTTRRGGGGGGGYGEEISASNVGLVSTLLKINLAVPERKVVSRADIYMYI